jgi:hypothetical protein
MWPHTSNIFNEITHICGSASSLSQLQFDGNKPMYRSQSRLRKSHQRPTSRLMKKMSNQIQRRRRCTPIKCSRLRLRDMTWWKTLSRMSSCGSMRVTIKTFRLCWNNHSQPSTLRRAAWTSYSWSRRSKSFLNASLVCILGTWAMMFLWISPTR